jgi:hypothetical protein
MHFALYFIKQLQNLVSILLTVIEKRFLLQKKPGE